MKSRRKQLFVDQAIQGSLLKRVLLHWSLYFVTLLVLLLIFQYFYSLFNPAAAGWDTFAFHNTFTFLVLLTLLPIFLYDTLKFTSRFAGPFGRLRKSFEKLAAGEDVAPLEVRQDDFLYDFATHFNKVLDRLKQSESHSRDPELAETSEL